MRFGDRGQNTKCILSVFINEFVRFFCRLDFAATFLLLKSSLLRIKDIRVIYFYFNGHRGKDVIIF